MRAGERAVAALGALLALLGAVLLRVPGVRFSAYLSFCAAAGCLLWLLLCLFARKSRIGKVCKVIFLVILSAGLFLFGALEVLILRGQEDRSALPADAVIVLGAGVNGETPSLALWTRIRVAAAYLEAHPDIPAVLSGGQGPGEDISEAVMASLTAAAVLIARGQCIRASFRLARGDTAMLGKDKNGKVRVSRRREKKAVRA